MLLDMRLAGRGVLNVAAYRDEDPTGEKEKRKGDEAKFALPQLGGL
jgi:hypothetical protein